MSAPTWARRGASVALALAVGAGVALAAYATSVQPGAAVVRAVLQLRGEVTPPATFAAVVSTVRVTRGVPVRASGAPDAAVDVGRPRESTGTALPVIVWIHGGGFVANSAGSVLDYAVLLAHEGFVVVDLDYSLAPEARYPVPVVQANAALRWVESSSADFGGDPSRVLLGGDSAGAQIASQVAAVQTDRALAGRMRLQPAVAPDRLRGVVLFCGPYDMADVGASRFPELRTFLWAYTGTRDWRAYPRIDELSTTATATAAYPPTFVSVGDADPFSGQEVELARHLRTVGVPVTALTWTGSGDGLPHEYQFDFTRPQARTAFAATVRFLRDRTGSARR